MGLNDPTTSSAFVTLLLFSQQASWKVCGVTETFTGHSSYSWLSKGEVTALVAFSHFPLALRIMIVMGSISEMSVWSQS